MKLSLFIVVLLTGCAAPAIKQYVSTQPSAAVVVQTPPMPGSVTTNNQQSFAADVLAAPLTGHQVTTLGWTIDTNHTCAWWTIQGSDDGVTWTNEYSIMTAEQMPTNNQLTFTNSNPQHYWRYVIHN